MNKRCLIALLAVPLLALPARAEDPFAPGLPFKVECGGNLYFRVLNQQNGWGCSLGPWYNYWPLEAHYQVPALPCYPFWPAPQALVPGGASVTLPPPPHCPAPVPPPGPAVAAPPPAAAPQQAYFRTVGYGAPGYPVYSQAPAWWYGR